MEIDDDIFKIKINPQIKIKGSVIPGKLTKNQKI
jgi:hypothetical protein